MAQQPIQTEPNQELGIPVHPPPDAGKMSGGLAAFLIPHSKTESIKLDETGRDLGAGLLECLVGG